ncbi:MAG: septum formation initiator family protein, partial [Actinomycetales bacterium]|nr:septum formation initiator family protein [Actinomycetales bacterium]
VAAQVEQAKKDVASMQVERKRWDDPVYVRSQARDRLYYVMPGEVSYLVMDSEGIDPNDTSGTVGAQMADRRNTTEITNKIRESKDNWVDSLLYTVVHSGVDQPAN